MNYKEYLLVCLAEECAEVIQNCTKIQRFGWHDRNITIENARTNLEELNLEFNDIIAIVQLLAGRGVDIGTDDKLIKAKTERTHKWANYAAQQGRVDLDK